MFQARSNFIMVRLMRWVSQNQLLLMTLSCIFACIIILGRKGYLFEYDFCGTSPHYKDYRIHDKGLIHVDEGNGQHKAGQIKESEMEIQRAEQINKHEWSNEDNKVPRLEHEGAKAGERCVKQIQIWTESLHWASGGRERLHCPNLSCDLLQVEGASVELMDHSDAVIFHYLSHWDWDLVHQHKKPGQKWIFHSAQSAANTRRSIIPPRKYYNNSFDYIMSFRHHPGNIFGDFGRMLKKKQPDSTALSTNWAKTKTRLIAWVGNDCNGTYIKWKRMDFIHALAKLIPMNLYGKCGSEECEVWEGSCHKKLATHKFLLSLENCNCRNFITDVWEKSFRNNMVPVVYGPPREDYERVMPKDSFIHVQDFTSLQTLADYLLELSKDDKRYSRYFAWKKDWEVESIHERILLAPNMMCQVVERLVKDEEAAKQGAFKPIEQPDWEKWWFGSCNNSKHFPINMETL